MQIEFIVHAVTTVPHKTTVELHGQKVVAAVDCLEVELRTADENLHGSFTARFFGPDAGLARAKFTKDSKHVWPIL